MPTYYINPATGNDGFTGTSWADAWLTMQTGSTAARVAPGDTIRIAKSPDPTSTGQVSKWTIGPIPAAVNITASSSTTPIVVKAAANHGLVTDDICFITGHGTNTKANGAYRVTYVSDTVVTLEDSEKTVGAATGTGGTIRKYNARSVLLSTDVAMDVCNCDRGWTGVDAGCTATVDTADWREGYGAAKFVLTAAAVTGVQAFCGTTGLDLSSFKQASFWVKSTVALAAGDFKLTFCEDANGSTGINDFAIPAVAAAGNWQAVTVNYGTGLGSSINSVALNQVVDKGALTIELDNILACKATTEADSITLNSIISLNSTGMGGDPAWYGMSSMRNRVVVLDGPQPHLPTAVYSTYGGASATGILYKRECHTLSTIAATSSSATTNQVMEAGTATSPTTYSGGWNPVSGEQDGETWFDGRNGWGYNYYIPYDYINFDHLSSVRFAFGFRPDANWVNITNGNIANCYYGIYTGAKANYCNYSFDSVIGCSLGWQPQTPSAYTVYKSKNVFGCSYAAYIDVRCVFTTFDINNIIGGNYGYYVVNYAPVGARLINARTAANVSAGVYNIGAGSTLSCFNCKADDTWTQAATASTDSRIYSQKHNQTAGNHVIFCEGATITLQTGDSQNGSAWAMSITSTRTRAYPVLLKLARIAVTGACTLTCKVYTKLASANVSGQLRIMGGYIAGVASDVTAAISSTSWTEYTIVCYPTEAGEVELYAEGWYVATATAIMYVDTTMTFLIT